MCRRFTIPLKLESNETSEAESEASSSQTVSDDSSEDSSEVQSDAESYQKLIQKLISKIDSEASENVSNTSSKTCEEFIVPQCASVQTYQNAKSVATQTVSEDGSEDLCCTCCFWSLFWR